MNPTKQLIFAKTYNDKINFHLNQGQPKKRLVKFKIDDFNLS